MQRCLSSCPSRENLIGVSSRRRFGALSAVRWIVHSLLRPLVHFFSRRQRFAACRRYSLRSPRISPHEREKERTIRKKPLIAACSTWSSQEIRDQAIRTHYLSRGNFLGRTHPFWKKVSILRTRKENKLRRRRRWTSANFGPFKASSKVRTCVVGYTYNTYVCR